MPDLQALIASSNAQPVKTVQPAAVPVANAPEAKPAEIKADTAEITKKPNKEAMPQGGWGKVIASYQFTGWGQLLDGRNKAGAAQFFTQLGSGVAMAAAGIYAAVKSVILHMNYEDGYAAMRNSKGLKVAGAIGAVAALTGLVTKIYSMVDAYKGARNKAPQESVPANDITKK